MAALPSTSTSPPESSKKPSNGPPTWFAAILAATAVTAAVVIPGAIYLRRKKNMRFSTTSAPPRRIPRNVSIGALSSVEAVSVKSSSTPATPPRRQANTVGLGALPSMQDARSIRSPPLSTTDATSKASTVSSPGSEELKPFSSESKNKFATEADDFNPAFYTIKAFGMATFLVTFGALASVWGVKTVMGVENTQQFARRMRYLVLLHMPILSSRIHRSHLDSDMDSPQDSQPLSQPETDIEGWNWQDAEQRLKTAFEKDGLLAWAEAVLKELEAEEKLERKKRRELEEGSSRSASAA